MGNILSGTKYRVSPEGVSLMDETNNLAKQTGRPPSCNMRADSVCEKAFAELQAGRAFLAFRRDV